MASRPLEQTLDIAELQFDVGRAAVLTISAAAWITAFVIFDAACAPILATPRVYTKIGRACAAACGKFTSA